MASLHSQRISEANSFLLDCAHIGSLLRWGQQNGLRPAELVSLNDLLVQVHMQIADRLEQLIRDGCALHVALNTLIAEGWVAKAGDLSAQQIENGRNTK